MMGTGSRYWEKVNKTHSSGKLSPPFSIISGKSFRLVDVEIFSLFTFRYRDRFKATGCDRSLCTATKAAKAGNGRNAELKYWFHVQGI